MSISSPNYVPQMQNMLKPKKNKKDFELYVIEKYKVLKDLLNDPQHKQKQNKDFPTLKVLTERGSCAKESGRNSSCISYSNPSMLNDKSQMMKSIERQVITQKQVEKGGCKNKNLSYYKVGMEENVDKVSQPIQRMSERLDISTYQSDIKDNNYLVLPNISSLSSQHTLQSRKGSLSGFNMNTPIDGQIFIDQAESKILDVFQDHFNKSEYLSNVPNPINNQNNCNRLKTKQESLCKYKVQTQVQLLPELNLQYRSSSNDSSLTKASSHQVQEGGQIRKYLNLNKNYLSSYQEQSKETEAQSNADEQSMRQQLFKVSYDEIKTKDSSYQADNSNSQEKNYNNTFNELKLAEDHSIIDSTIRILIENESKQEQPYNLQGKQESYTLQGKQESFNFQSKQESYFQQSNNVQIPFQRQWAISSPFSRQSPYLSLQLPDIRKNRIQNEKRQLESFRFGNINKMLNSQQEKLNNNYNFSRNHFFDIHFSSFEHQQLQKKIQQKTEEKDGNQLMKISENGFGVPTIQYDQSHFKLKRKKSIFHQKDVVILDKMNLQKQLYGTGGSRQNNSTPSSIKNKRQTMKGNKDEINTKQRFVKPEINTKQRFVKPYTELPRNKKEKYQDQSKDIENINEVNLEKSGKVYENIFEKDYLQCEDSHSLNQQLIEGLEHNIDRFMNSLRQKVQSNKKLEEEIRQECYVFDFEQFITNIRSFINSSISKNPNLHGNQQGISFARNSILFDGVSTVLPASFKNSQFSTQKYDIKKLIYQLLNTQFGTKKQSIENTEIMPTPTQRRIQYFQGQTNSKNGINSATDSESRFSSINLDILDKHENSPSQISRKNSSLIASPKFSNQKAQIKQNSKFSNQKSHMSENNSFSEHISSLQQNPTKVLINLTNGSISEQPNNLSQFAIPQVQSPHPSISKLKSMNNKEEGELMLCEANKNSEEEEKKDEHSKERNFIAMRQIENRRKEEDIFVEYMQFAMNEIDNYSKNNMKITPNVFDQLVTIIMDILLEFQYSNLSINQYMGALQKRAETIVENTVKTELPKHLYDKLITVTVSKMELQNKVSVAITRFLQALFEVEEDLIIKRYLVDTSGNNIRSQQLLQNIKQAAQHCSLNYLQFYSLKLFLYETMKDIQVNYKTILKALSSLESFRHDICCDENIFTIQSSQQKQQQNQENNTNSENRDNQEDDDNNNQQRQDEYIIDFANKSSMRKLIEELEWILQTEMVEFMQSDSKLHHELQLFISDLVFCLVRLYPQQQILLHKKLKLLQKSFFDSIIFYFCQLLFKKKIPIEVIRNIFITSYQLATILDFETKLILQIEGFNPILALSFIFSSVHYMDRYRAKCNISSNVSLINVKLQDSNQQKQEDDNAQLIILTIQRYQLIWVEFLLTCYFSSSNCYNTYDLKAALTINKLDQSTLQKWISYLKKLDKYFDQKCLQKFSQELQISMSYLK